MIDKKPHDFENYTEAVEFMRAKNHSKTKNNKDYMKQVNRRCKIKTGSKMTFCDEASFVEELDRIGEIEILFEM